jgi:hypothetical protein
LHPFFFDQTLAFWAVSVTTRIVRISLKTTVAALFDVAAEFGCPTHFNMMHHLLVCVGQRVIFQVIVAIDAKDVCHFWLVVALCFHVSPPIRDRDHQEGF